MDIYQAAHYYVSHVPGVNLETGVPTAERNTQAMQALMALAAQSDLPADGKFHYLNQVLAATAEVALSSAAAFQRAIVANPEQRDLAKVLELSLAAMSERSPETWQHILHHTSLSMLAYERQVGKIDLNDIAQQRELLTLFLGSMGHDMGKLGVDPLLLHKSTRVDRDRFAAVLQHYDQRVPAYPEKLHDLIFLQEANEGKIIFAEPGSPSTASAAPRNILDLGKDLRRSEEYWVGDDERQRHNAIWERINTHAQSSIPSGAWLNPSEQQTLTMAQRGTVTPLEKKIIESHDDMSEAFFTLAPISPGLQEVRQIVSMDRFRHTDTPQAESRLAEHIHTTDVFEALAANRSYRASYTVEEVLKVMEGMAKEGKVNRDMLETMVANGTVDAYANAFGMQHSSDLPPLPANPGKSEQTAASEPETRWAKRISLERPASGQHAWTARITEEIHALSGAHPKH